ncbi:MAG: iron ABC transporter permease [Acidimicrobiia bacterium]|nr:iron ABC transporter permease [Acidimicrobiia bacterium]
MRLLPASRRVEEARPLRRLSLSAVGVVVALLLGAALAGLLVGAVGLSPRGVLAEVADHLPFVSVDSGLGEREAAIVWDLRLPRVVLAALVGATLAAAGAAYQGVFRNPLADPYLLGVAAGAGLGATVGIVTVGPAAALVPAAAFAGAVVAVMLTYALGGIAGGGRAGTTLVLAGVAVAAFFTAVQTFVQQRHADTVREVYSWILGRLSTVGWSEVALLAPYAAVSLVVLLLHRRLLDVLAVGEEEAETLGVSASRVRLLVVAAATLGTAAAVAVSGLIGFVGIVVPHAVRLLVGSSYRVIVPLSVLGGAAFLVLADLGARTLAAPAEVPLGVITAFVGAPFFAVVLRSSRRGWGP